MCQMTRMASSKFMPSSTQPRRCEEEPLDCLDDKRSVNEEYLQAFRTKSYTDIYNKVQVQLESKGLDSLAASSPLPSLAHFSNHLVQPRQEALINWDEGSTNFHRLINDFFDASFQGSHVCELLLQCVHQARMNYRIVQKVISLATSTCGLWENDTNTIQFHAVLKELNSFAKLKNPLLVTSASKFRELHDDHGLLLRGLMVKLRKIRRRAKLIRCFKNFVGFSLVISCTALAIVVLVLAIHGMVGIVAAPPLGLCSLGFVQRRIKWVKRELKRSSMEGLVAQLEVAAKGVYILIKDLDTMSRLVRRLGDEIDHGKVISDICVRSGRREVVKEVVREFQINQTCFLEQLEELEEHVYLCFLNLNRLRTLILRVSPTREWSMDG
ncbi:hypothetical protein NMG60_11024475 [Bertholletia excelsa]